MRLQLERDALVSEEDRLAPGVEKAGAADGVEAAGAQVQSARPASRLDLAIGLAGAALIAVDMVLLLGNRRRRSSSQGDKAKA
jgi:hypothetical protein